MPAAATARVDSQLFVTALALPALVVAACSADSDHGPDGARPDALAVVDATDDARDSGECGPGVPGCSCVPAQGSGSCVHSNGGTFEDGACSPSYQCCDGEWVQGHGSCGACTCTSDGSAPGCTTSEEVCFPAFDAVVAALPADVRDEMMGVSWHPNMGCPSLDSLRLVTLGHWGFDGQIHTGELVIAADAASAVVTAFEEMYLARFPIERMQRVDVYGGDDDASMAANNTSAFNCRRVTGGTGLSAHSFGTAIDINPVQNPYVRNGTVLPPAGSAYLDRGQQQQGMIVRPGPVTHAFDSIGWGWGGDWTGLKDYQHVSRSGT